MKISPPQLILASEINFGFDKMIDDHQLQVRPELETAHITNTQPSSQRQRSQFKGDIEIEFKTYVQENSQEPPGGGCAICLEEYNDGDTLAVITACNHRFHVVCITLWLGQNDTCPLCRSCVV